MDADYMNKAVADVMMRALHNNTGYQPGEKVVIIAQAWNPSLPERVRPVFNRSVELCEALRHVYLNAGVDVSLMTYVPERADSTVEPTKKLLEQVVRYESSKGVPEIIIAPTGYSITHTDWRKAQNQKGSRIATMSNTSLAMFEPGGPFDIQGDYEEIKRETLDIVEKLRQTRYVKLDGPYCNLLIRIDPNPERIDAAIGRITKPREYDNWLGSEAFAVPLDPREGGDSCGWFVVPVGWGGREQVKYDTKFYISKGRFVRLESVEKSPTAQKWIDDNLASMVFRKPNYDIVAELGIGTNPAISDKWLMDNWSVAVAEKKRDSANGRILHVAHGSSSGFKGINNVDIHQDFLILDVQNIDFDFQP